MRSLVELASQRGIITPAFERQLNVWMRLRNQVVHSAVVVSKAQATEIVNGVMAWIQQQ